MSTTINNRTVWVYTHNKSVGGAIAALIASRGINTTNVVTLEDLPENSLLVTEVSLIEESLRSNPLRILVLDNGSQHYPMDAHVISLSRPLSQNKIEKALNSFLVN